MKKHLIIVFSLFISSHLQAQEGGHYLYLNAGGGVHNLSYNLKNGNEKGGFGYTFQAGYGYFFNQHWGLQAGMGIGSGSAVGTVNFSTTVPAIDADGETYEYRTNYNNWKEKQHLLFLDIPVGMQYKFEINEKINLLAGAGLKISIPITKTYRTTGGEIITTGYYSQYNVILQELPRHGFVNLTDQLTGDVPVKTSYSLFADIGALYGLPYHLDLYAGGYVNLGMNNVANSSGNLVYQQDGIYNGMLNSDQTDNARTVAFGLKIGVLWHFGKSVAEGETGNK